MRPTSRRPDGLATRPERLPGRRRLRRHRPGCGTIGRHLVHRPSGRSIMSKRGRKRRSRKGNAANHGKRPNA
ncbi:hypothetical protein DNL40_13815 [Xylanimonas oleitrophica]|uniref:Uncharacterized protein n=1 Tax=Xylanimonas oleitrophica TaxID=2607479 RepID=A0A2W5WLB6_9MICO|nr:hypothetical protein DNL40_13815 [Xylanimonas oleitrophica]